MRLAQCPVPVDMYFVKPHVKRGDYYLVMNPVTGRRMWVYPKQMGEDSPFFKDPRFAVTSALGNDGDSVSSLLSALDPRQFVQEMTELRQDVGSARTYMRIAIGATVVTSLVAVWAITKKDRTDP